MKYGPDIPARFASIEAARRHCQTFFTWYNDHHRHAGLDCTRPPTSTTTGPTDTNIFLVYASAS